MWKPIRTLFKTKLGKVAVALSTFPVWKAIYNIIDAWGNLQMISDYLPRIRQFFSSTSGTFVVMFTGFALVALQLFRQGRQAKSKTEETDSYIQQAVYTHAGVMFQELESEHNILFFINVFNGLPDKLAIAEEADGFILLQDRPLPTRPQFLVSTDPLNDRKSTIGLTQKVSQETAVDIKSRFEKGEQLSFSFTSLHVYCVVEGTRHRLKLPDGLICRMGVHYSNAIYGSARF
jgi:hypothetical protein